MRLHVESAAFQNAILPKPDKDTPLLGNVACGREYLFVHRQNGGLGFLSFDPFIGHLRERALSPLSGDDAMLATNALDLNGSTATFTHARIFFPKALAARPAEKLQDHVSILGSDDYAALSVAEGGKKTIDAITLGAPDNPSGQQPNPSTYLVYSFRGRSLVIPEIMVSCSGGREWVSVGTRVRQLVERELDPASPYDLARVCVTRRWRGRQIPVYFDCDKDRMVFELPLLKGDQVRW